MRGARGAARRGEGAREGRMQHGETVGTQESGDRARPRHRRSRAQMRLSGRRRRANRQRRTGSRRLILATGRLSRSGRGCCGSPNRRTTDHTADVGARTRCTTAEQHRHGPADEDGGCEWCCATSAGTVPSCSPHLLPVTAAASGRCCCSCCAAAAL